MDNFDFHTFSKIFENASTLLIVTNTFADETIVKTFGDVNKLIGYSGKALTSNNKGYKDLIHDDDVNHYLCESQQGLLDVRCDEIVHSEYRIRHDEGHYIWVKDHTMLIRDKGNTKQLVHVLTNISEEIAKRETVSAQKQRLELVLHKAGFGMWEWQSDTDSLKCDKNWSHLIGFPQSINGMKMSRLFALIHPDDVAQFKHLLECLQQGDTSKTDIVVRIRHMSGKWRYHACTASIVIDPLKSDTNSETINTSKSTTIFMSHSDISSQKENELAAISALDNRNQFFARVSHEIRTPLHGILGMLSLVKKEMISCSGKTKIDKITTHSEHLLYLLNDVLDLAKLNEAKLKISSELVSITEIMNQVERLFASQAKEKNLKFTTIPPALTQDMVVTDKVRLTQVLSNLVSNAIKYTYTGEVVVFTKVIDDKLRLCVQDTGIGIKNTRTIFDAYTQEAAGFAQGTSSTGLGLEIVKKLCDLLGIEIRVVSMPSGSLFELLLSTPMPNILVSVPTKKQHHSGLDELNNIQVLIVDDSDINREIVSEMLSSIGAVCEQANDGYEALKMVTNGQVYDVILMDKHMPNMNGIDTTREIRQNTVLQKQPVIIALTADAFDIDNEHWFEQGIDELITKPFDMDILVKTISRCLRR